MRLFFTADLHWGHANILTFEPQRQEILGKTLEEHDDALLKRINSRLLPEDRLIILGDLGLSSASYLSHYVGQLKCRKSLIRGNHDKHSDSQYLRMGFDVVCYEMKMKIAGRFVRLTHHPYRKPWWRTCFPWQWVEKDRHKRPSDRGGILLHGHIHSGGHGIGDGSHLIRGRMINVGVDVNNYFPIPMEKVSQWVQAVAQTCKLK